MKKRTLAILVLALTAGLAAGTVARAGHVSACSGATAYHQPSLEIRHKNNAVDGVRRYFTIIQGRNARWDSLTCLTFLASSTPVLNEYAANYGATGWLGLTSLESISSCHINKASIKLNRYYLDSPSYTDSTIAKIACHEIGHTLGLSHSASTTSCMNHSSTSISPDAHDVDTIRSIYAHQGCI